MQIVHRATSLADAESARDVLISSGIPSHISKDSRQNQGALPGTEFIRVMVDNRTLDRARRAIAVWKKSQG